MTAYYRVVMVRKTYSLCRVFTKPDGTRYVDSLDLGHSRDYQVATDREAIALAIAEHSPSLITALIREDKHV